MTRDDIIEGDLLDRRQRLAAALILSAIDLPAPIGAWARLCMEAASVCPGVTMNQIDANSGRVAQLRRARGLLDEMIEEFRP